MHESESSPPTEEGATGGDAEGQPDEAESQGIDYSGSQEEIDAAKQEARDDDAKRLAKEHE